MEPPAPEAVVTELVEEGPTFAGLGIRRQYRMWFRADKSGPFVDWLLILPNRPEGDDPVKKDGKVVCEGIGKVPVVLMLNYRGNQSVLDESEVKLPEGEWRKPSSKLSPEESENGAMRDTRAGSVILADFITARGYARLTACYAQVSPDVEVGRGDPEELAYTRIFELWPKRDESRNDNITSLGAWAWTLSFADGRKLSGPEEWPARRAEILGIFAKEMYGMEQRRHRLFAACKGGAARGGARRAVCGLRRQPDGRRRLSACQARLRRECLDRDEGVPALVLQGIREIRGQRAVDEVRPASADRGSCAARAAHRGLQLGMVRHEGRVSCRKGRFFGVGVPWAEGPSQRRIPGELRHLPCR